MIRNFIYETKRFTSIDEENILSAEYLNGILFYNSKMKRTNLYSMNTFEHDK